ncbi:hypothetical protein [Mesonia sp. K4-1]|uniref:hypothetical protein n=1 Tax=Mesonia sp. K4-1 TaxID=2602760 RepID=UPI0011C8B434|nr:hypothetical protein [Mesonia sp. K4-1]TXK74417.1 hypothetical protein FT986_11525 [Mesonia sp. K4-1]
MNNRNSLKLIGILLISAISFVVGSHIYNKKFHENVKKQPKMYCYDYFRGKDYPVSVLIIEDLDLKQKYLHYYEQLKSGKEPYLPDGIPLKGMPQYHPVYVMEFTKDSLLANVVSYYDRGNLLGGSYTRGWILSECLHEEPPKKKF